jgi:hypothetical protein
MQATVSPHFDIPATYANTSNDQARDERAMVNLTFARVLRFGAARPGAELVGLGCQVRGHVADYVRGRGPWAVLGSQAASEAIADHVLA